MMENTLFDIASKAITYLLKKAVTDPKKRKAIIEKARMLVTKVQDLLAKLEVGE